MTLDLTATAESPDWDRSGLPAWSYTNAELLEAEKDLLFRRHWQVACHVNDIPNAGDYIATDICGERGLVIRGRDGQIRAFHNLCRHRGSRVVADQKGTCKSAIICPFHGWAYNLDGTLRGAAQPRSLPDLDRVAYGLKPIEMDIWHGFVFIRFKPGPQPPISQVLSRFNDEVAQYRLSEFLPDGAGFWSESVEANWKCVRDVDNEGYHVPMAHPGLHDLFGSNYYDEPFLDGTARSYSKFREGDGSLWSVKMYKALLPQLQSLDAEHRQAWLYIGIFPNTVLGIYPDSVMYYNEVPGNIGSCVQSGAVYRRADEDRRMRAARYLSGRIDRLTSKEDEQLIEWCWESAFSSGFDGVILSDLEIGVRSYHDMLRTLFPVLDEAEPSTGELIARNKELLAAQ